MARFRTLLLLLCVCWTGAASAVSLVLTDGKLSGARGVDVGGILYDVDFRSGTALDVYGADMSGVFFTTLAEATSATQALSSQVLTGIYDTDPSMTYGVPAGGMNGAGFGAFVTAYAFSNLGCAPPSCAWFYRFLNYADESADFMQRIGHGTSFGTAGYLYADWSLASVSPVPLPGALGFILSGFGAMVAMQRRGRNASSARWGQRIKA